MEHQTSKRSVLFVASLTTFMIPFMVSAVNIALPAIQAEFSVDSVLLSWIATAYLLSTAVFLVPVGKIADIFGRRKIFITGIILFSTSTCASALVPSVALLIGLRILQGLGASMTMATGMAILTSVFPARERGKAIGIVVAAVYIGLSFGPFGGGLMTQYLGWRSIFLVNAPIGLAAVIVAFKYLKDEWADARGERLDIIGCLLYGCALIALIYGASRLTETTGIGLMLAGVIIMGAFVRREGRTAYPVFDINLFRTNRVFAFSSVAALINYAATYAVMFILSLYLQYIKAMTPQTAGLILVAQPLVQTLFSPFAGRLSDRIEPGVIASLGMALTAFGLLLLIFIGEATSSFFIISTLILLGLGFALFSSPNMNAIMSSVDKRFYGIASGVLATMRLIGQMLSMAIVTVLFALIIGRSEITPQTHDVFLKSIKIAFAVFTILCCAGIYFSLSRGKLRKPFYMEKSNATKH